VKSEAGTELKLESLSVFAQDIAQDAGAILRKRQSEGFEIAKKGRVNLVTEADLEAEKLIIHRITECYPDHGILAEESGLQAEKSRDIRWIVDPLDGTTNYAHGYPFFCVSIGVAMGEEVVVGVVFDPVAREMFSAIRGQGAFLNGKSISVSRQDSMEDSLLVTGFSYEEDEIQENLKLFNRMMTKSRSVRRDGSAALDLCYVACGRYEGFWELSLHPWDVAAGGLIVEEAGGQVSRFDASPATIYDREILATNGLIHRRLSVLLTAGQD
jgi:myo-inositol-1(or 4)-monophosphatase